MADNDKILLEKAKSGDINAFEKLVEAYQRKVYNIAFRMIGSPDDAYDLAQEVLIRIYKSIGGFKEQSSFSTWVYRITTNVCLDEIRKRKLKRTVSLDQDIKLDDSEVKREIESDDPPPDELAAKKEIKRTVTEAIGLLNEEHRTVIVLRDIQGFSYEEIAKIINCPEGTVKSRINRARQALKIILEKKRELIEEYYVK